MPTVNSPCCGALIVLADQGMVCYHCMTQISNGPAAPAPLPPGRSTHVVLRHRTRDRDVTVGAMIRRAEVGRVHIRHCEQYEYLSGLYVQPDMRRHGIGRALLSEAIDLYGARRIELVASAMPHADAAPPGAAGMRQAVLEEFYRSAGFQLGPSLWRDRAPRESDAHRMYREPAPSTCQHATSRGPCHRSRPCTVHDSDGT